MLGLGLSSFSVDDAWSGLGVLLYTYSVKFVRLYRLGNASAPSKCTYIHSVSYVIPILGNIVLKANLNRGSLPAVPFSWPNGLLYLWGCESFVVLGFLLVGLG